MTQISIDRSEASFSIDNSSLNDNSIEEEEEDWTNNTNKKHHDKHDENHKENYHNHCHGSSVHCNGVSVTTSSESSSSVSSSVSSSISSSIVKSTTTTSIPSSTRSKGGPLTVKIKNSSNKSRKSNKAKKVSRMVNIVEEQNTEISSPYTRLEFSSPSSSSESDDHVIGLGRKAIRLHCPMCNREITTRPLQRVDCYTVVMCTVLLILFMPLCWLPLVFSSCKATDHYCSNCHRKIGTTGSCDS